MPQVRRPTIIQVGYIPFDVTYLDDEAWDKKGLDLGDGGQCNGAKGTIDIRDTDQHPIHVKEILLHEVLHACFYASQMTIENRLHREEDIEETVVGRLSPVLLQVIRDNPDLVDFLRSP